MSSEFAQKSSPANIILEFPDISGITLADPLIPTIFHESWWLDIVSGGNYGLAEVFDNGAVAGRLPYYIKKRFGMRKCIMPPMTHFMGPAVIDRGGNMSTRFLRRAQITRELLNQLPPASITTYKCHRAVTDVIAFQQERYRTSVQFTFEAHPDTEERLWMKMSSKKRKKIRSAYDAMTLTDIRDSGEFWHLYDSNLQKKGMRNSYDPGICRKLIDACLARGQGRIYAVKDAHHRLAAAVFCIWDATTSFYFMSTHTPDIHNGACSLLTWEAMKEAARRGLIFDFDGFINSNGVLFLAEFGGQISPRFIATKTTIPGSMALSLSELRRKSRFFF